MVCKFFSKLAKNRPGTEGKETQVTEGLNVSGGKTNMPNCLACKWPKTTKSIFPHFLTLFFMNVTYFLVAMTETCWPVVRRGLATFNTDKLPPPVLC